MRNWNSSKLKTLTLNDTSRKQNDNPQNGRKHL